jgi:hypothetical protein
MSNYTPGPWTAKKLGNIAAAPDLLDALERFEAVLGADLSSDEPMSGADTLEWLTAWWPNAQEALRKARGEE